MDTYLVDFPKPRADSFVTASVPGSKSITNRLLLLAALSDDEVTLTGCLSGEDSQAMIQCLQALGFSLSLEASAAGLRVSLRGHGGDIPQKEASLYAFDSATTARFLLAVLAFSSGTYTLDGSRQLRNRPLSALIEALLPSGARIESLEKPGHLPLRVTGAFSPLPDMPSPAPSRKIPLDYAVCIDESSQHLSALLLSSAFLSRRLQKPVRVRQSGRHGTGYIALTTKLMQDFGIRVSEEALSYTVHSASLRAPRTYAAEADISSACYIYAAAAVLGISSSVRGVRADSAQPDTSFFQILAKMGCRLIRTSEGGLIVQGPKGGALQGGFTVSMAACSDQALTLAAIAPYADAPITLTGIHHLRFQECDRIEAMRHNLSLLGIQTSLQYPGTMDEALTVYPGKVKAASLPSFQDHRVAMAFALSGLRASGVRVLSPSCCQKTFPHYFAELDRIKRQLSETVI